MLVYMIFLQANIRHYCDTTGLGNTLMQTVTATYFIVNTHTSSLVFFLLFDAFFLFYSSLCLCVIPLQTCCGAFKRSAATH